MLQYVPDSWHSWFAVGRLSRRPQMCAKHCCRAALGLYPSTTAPVAETLCPFSLGTPLLLLLEEYCLVSTTSYYALFHHHQQTNTSMLFLSTWNLLLPALEDTTGTLKHPVPGPALDSSG